MKKLITIQKNKYLTIMAINIYINADKYCMYKYIKKMLLVYS